MDLEQAIDGGRAVPADTSAPVARGAIKHLIGEAIEAPSAADTQPGHFTVIADDVLLAHIAAGAKSHMADLLSKRSGVEPWLCQHRADDWAVEKASLGLADPRRPYLTQ